MPESSQYKQEFRSLGPGNLQASPGDHTHDGTTSKAFPWVAYTPAWTAATTNPVIGNGTLTGKYVKLGSLVYYKYLLVAGSTTTYGSGNYRFSLPFVPSSDVSIAGAPVGQAMLQDVSLGARYFRQCVILTVGVATIYLGDDAGTVWAPTVPFTMASTDIVAVWGSYESV